MRTTAVLMLCLAGLSGCANQGLTADGALPPDSSDGKADGISGYRRLYKLDGVYGWGGDFAEASDVIMSHESINGAAGIQAEGVAWGFSAAHPTSQLKLIASASDPTSNPYTVGLIGFHKLPGSSTWKPINCQLGGKTYNVADEVQIQPASGLITLSPFGLGSPVSFGMQSCGVSTDELEDFAFLPYVYDSVGGIDGLYDYNLTASCGQKSDELCPSSEGEL